MSVLARAGAACATGLGLVALLSGCVVEGSVSTTSTGPHQAVRVEIPGSAEGAAPIPRPKHVVVVVVENERAGQVIGAPDAPYITSLARSGADLTESYALTHPTQPNYVALFSGSSHGLRDDSCQQEPLPDNQAHQLIEAGFSFASYAEGLPRAGSKVCVVGRYARKHAPWTDFSNVPARVQLPYTSFPKDLARLPDVAWAIPDMCHDMHDCSVADGDAWLEAELGPYARWARAHDSLLVVTFDEDDYSGNNRIATIFSGARVQPGRYDDHIRHYSVLACLERMFGLPLLGGARKAAPIPDIWR